MKFINFFIFILITFNSCNKKTPTQISELTPEYKLLTTFSDKIASKTGLVLSCYGINKNISKDYPSKKGVANFTVGYSLYKQRQNEISIHYARNLLLSLTRNLLNEINSNTQVKSHLDVSPLTANLLDITIHFKDENKIDLGQGVSIVYFANGKIKYKGYNIYEYTGQYPAHGKHFTIHEETYEEAFNTLQESGEVALF